MFILRFVKFDGEVVKQHVFQNYYETYEEAEAEAETHRRDRDYYRTEVYVQELYPVNQEPRIVVTYSDKEAEEGTKG